MRRVTYVGVALVMLLAASATRSDAAMVTFNTLAGWSGAVGAYGTETFNGFAADVSYKGVSVGLAGGMSVTGNVGLNGATTQKIDAVPHEFAGFYNINGTTELLGDVAGPGFIRFDFATPLSAWSMDVKGIADGGRLTSITVYDAANAVLGSIAMASDNTNQQLQFYGWQLTGGDAAAYMTITNAGGGNDVFGMENVRFVAAVPEPATLGLLALGFAAAVVRARRSR